MMSRAVVLVHRIICQRVFQKRVQRHANAETREQGIHHSRPDNLHGSTWQVNPRLQFEYLGQDAKRNLAIHEP